jgi:hypothetical protein
MDHIQTTCGRVAVSQINFVLMEYLDKRRDTSEQSYKPHFLFDAYSQHRNCRPYRQGICSALALDNFCVQFRSLSSEEEEEEEERALSFSGHKFIIRLFLVTLTGKTTIHG